MQNSVKSIGYPVALLSVLSYAAIAYAFPRSDFWLLITCFSVSFGGYYYFLYHHDKWSEKQIFALSFLFRVILLAAVPSLSDDFYRYLWDGQLLLKGINPFAFTPTEAIEKGLMEKSVLYQYMNSPNYHSVYPPTNQAVFALSAWAGDWKISLLVLKTLALAAETGTLFFIIKISKHFKHGIKPLVVYGLNPLVIVEFSGNAHSEVFMLFFIALFVWLFIRKHNTWAGLSLALAICSKLIPVFILPLLIAKIGWKNGLKFCLITGVFCLLLFIPFLSAETLNAQKGLSLYFNHFEFYGAIHQFGKLLDGYVWRGLSLGLKVSSLLLMLFIYLKPTPSTQQLLKNSLLLFTVYFLFSSTIHPWYVAALVFYAAFTNLNYLLVWTYMLCFTYITYQTDDFLQNETVLWGQFLVLVWMLLKERKEIITSQDYISRNS